MSSSGSGDLVFIGVDVGTSSVRAMGVDQRGRVYEPQVAPLHIYKPAPLHFQQSTVQIWNAVATVVRGLLAKHNLSPAQIGGLGFDATCSLVLIGKNGKPLSVTPTPNMEGAGEGDEFNVMMWMDHRAGAEAEQINEAGHEVLKSVGGRISLEMEPPKLRWIQTHLNPTLQDTEHFFDLADFLSFQATGSLTRSLCCTVCKWGFQASEKGQGWDDTFWKQNGLGQFCEEKYLRIGQECKSPGAFCGPLSQEAADHLGLNPGLPVAVGIIDAHAGAVSMLGVKAPGIPNAAEDLSLAGEVLIMIAGTSTCHLTIKPSSVFVPGVWGPYYGAILPDLWTHEAGQSSVGPVLDMVTRQYVVGLPNAPQDLLECQRWLLEHIRAWEGRLGSEGLAELTRDVHVWPDYHGNRSPLADPNMSGSVSGLRLTGDTDPLVYAMTLYVAHIQSLALMTKYIMDRLVDSGYSPFRAVYMCGGLQANWLYVQVHADVCGLPMVIPETQECVALGAAILGASGSGSFPSLPAAIAALGPNGHSIQPRSELTEFYRRKYEVFKRLEVFQREAREIMAPKM